MFQKIFDSNRSFRGIRGKKRAINRGSKGAIAGENRLNELKQQRQDGIDQRRRKDPLGRTILM